MGGDLMQQVSEEPGDCWAVERRRVLEGLRISTSEEEPRGLRSGRKGTSPGEQGAP